MHAGDDSPQFRAAVPVPGSLDPLERLAGIARELTAPRLMAEASERAERAAAGLFYVACVGQVKRGKSSLLNALLGQAVLPVGVLPVTAIPTIVRYGPRPGAAVRFRDGGIAAIELGEVADYVSEHSNPGNCRNVQVVEIALPSPMLRSGMCLVDTPGLDSIFEAATGATHAFVPHIDAALVVLGTDPPISGAEAALVQAVAQHVNDIVVVLSKADRVSDSERSEALAFAGRVLAERLGRPVGPILELSAKEQLELGPTRDWPSLVGRLADLAERSGHHIAAASLGRAVDRLCRLLGSLITREREALIHPVRETDQRLARLRGSAAAIDERLRHLGHMLAAEQLSVREVLAERQRRFLAAAWPAAEGRLTAELARRERSPGTVLRRELAEFVRTVACEQLDPWLEQEERFAETSYRELAARFAAMANGFLGELEGSADGVLDRLPAPASAACGLDTPRRYHFYRAESRFVAASPLHWLVDLAGPGDWTRRRIGRQASEFLYWLIDTNSQRVQNDLAERVAESRASLEREVRLILEGARAWAEAVSARARSAQAAGSALVQRRLAKLDRLETEVAAIRSAAGLAR